MAAPPGPHGWRCLGAYRPPRGGRGGPLVGGGGWVIVRVRVAYLGPEHSFTHEAATALFGEGAEYLPAPRIATVFRLVEDMEADYGVVPVENSLEGPVGETLDSLARSMLHIARAAEMPIRLVIAGDPGAGRVYGHPHALAEAGHVIDTLGDLERVATASTSEAAARAAGEGGLCVCSRAAAEAHGLDIIETLDGEAENNYTRFIVLAWSDNPRDADRTSIITAMPDTPGALYHWLEPFARRHVNLKMIYSRPIPSKPWHYNFYIDIEGSRLDEKVAAALQEAARRSLFLRILGSYPVEKLNP